MVAQQRVAEVEFRPDTGELIFSGRWTVNYLSRIEQIMPKLYSKLPDELTVKRDSIEELDSAGAVLLADLEAILQQYCRNVKQTAMSEACESIYKLVQTYQVKEKKSIQQRSGNWLTNLGGWTVDKLQHCLSFVAFIGQFVVLCAQNIGRPKRLHWRSVWSTIDHTGYQALPIVALLTFLVGIVLTYQIAVQLSLYGASIYVVDLTGMIIFREFGPLITAIIVAGRTSTAYAAQIGTMKANEEIDALETMGISSLLRIVFPKVLGLIIAMPLLTVWADVFGVVGALVMSKVKLGISYSSFIDRFQYQISVSHYLVGLVKVPVFAALIALVGCYQGLQVSGSAASVGRKTTKSAVQAIFLIIIADAFFSVIFSVRGI